MEVVKKSTIHDRSLAQIMVLPLFLYIDKLITGNGSKSIFTRVVSILGADAPANLRLLE